MHICIYMLLANFLISLRCYHSCVCQRVSLKKLDGDDDGFQCQCS